jgi:hypothetical protein
MSWQKAQEDFWIWPSVDNFYFWLHPYTSRIRYMLSSKSIQNWFLIGVRNGKIYAGVAFMPLIQIS